MSPDTTSSDPVHHADASLQTELEREVSRRRTFAIISHPDAGKTTLTEKLLLYAGAIGFCFGGGIVNQLAVRLGKDLGAGAPFYGRQPGAEDVPKIMAPIQAHYADPKIDTGVGTGIEPFEAALKANGKKYEIFIYTGAQHGFHNDTTPRYDETAAKLATRRYMEFFNKNLG